MDQISVLRVGGCCEKEVTILLSSNRVLLLIAPAP
jgi:hypothetical protein